jgi:hypothetical protein
LRCAVKNDGWWRGDSGLRLFPHWGSYSLPIDTEHFGTSVAEINNDRKEEVYHA